MYPNFPKPPPLPSPPFRVQLDILRFLEYNWKHKILVILTIKRTIGIPFVSGPKIANIMYPKNLKNLNCILTFPNHPRPPYPPHHVVFTKGNEFSRNVRFLTTWQPYDFEQYTEENNMITKGKGKPTGKSKNWKSWKLSFMIKNLIKCMCYDQVIWNKIFTHDFRLKNLIFKIIDFLISRRISLFLIVSSVSKGCLIDQNSWNWRPTRANSAQLFLIWSHMTWNLHMINFQSSTLILRICSEYITSEIIFWAVSQFFQKKMSKSEPNLWFSMMYSPTSWFLRGGGGYHLLIHII